jgi:single-strand DNA-binding protein
MNKVIQIGNLTRDPESRVTKEGNQLCRFAIAVNSTWKNEDVLFLDVTCWNKTAENVVKFLKKGSKVAVEGRLKLESWVDKLGDKRSKICLVAESVEFLPTGDRQNTGQSQPQAGQQTSSVKPFSAKENKTPQYKKTKEPEPLVTNEETAFQAAPIDATENSYYDGLEDDIPF